MYNKKMILMIKYDSTHACVQCKGYTIAIYVVN